MTTIAQRSFAGGEIAPSLYARVDTSKYQTSLRQCRNMLVMRHGGAQNRPGTAFICQAKSTNTTVRMVPFESVTESTKYILVFTPGFMRVISVSSDTQVLDTSSTITGATNANPCVITTSGAHGLSTGDEVNITGIVGMTQLNSRNFRVTVLSGTTFSLQNMDGSSTNVNSTSYGTYTSGGTAQRVYTLATPFSSNLHLLQWAQDRNELYFSHPSVTPRKLTYTSAASWAFSAVTFAPTTSAPTNVTNNGAAGSTTEWVVTALASETYEESLQSSSTGSSATPSAGSPIAVSWTAVSGAAEYNVYKKVNGVYGLIGVAVGTSFSDTGITPDTSDTPPTARNPFGTAGDTTPAAVGFIQQRLTYGGTVNNPNKSWASRTGMFTNFTVSSPLQDDDAVTWSFVGNKLSRVRHLLELGAPLVFTSKGVWSLGGGSDRIIRPGEINPKQESTFGAGTTPPLIVGGSALYVQDRGSIIRDVGYTFEQAGYRGNDLTIHASHLFDRYTIQDWAYQESPHSVVWATKYDRANSSEFQMVGCTYVREQNIIAWHRHDTDGSFVQVCVIPSTEASGVRFEDKTYVVTRKLIGSDAYFYVERFKDRNYVTLSDGVFVDRSVSVDGTVSSNTMTLSEYLSGGWLYTSTLELTAALSYFAATDVGSQMHLQDEDGNEIRFTIDSYVSATVVRGRPHATVPASLQGAAAYSAAKAVNTVSGLWHLEGRDVAVQGDGTVVANPNNEAYTTVTVSSGTVTLPGYYKKIHVGLPYLCDIETLDIDTAQGESVMGRKKLVTEVNLWVEETLGLWAGPQPPSDDDEDPLEGLYEFKLRDVSDEYDETEPKTEVISLNVQARWNSNGRVFIRQVDPLPCTILAAAPDGMVPFRGGG